MAVDENVKKEANDQRIADALQSSLSKGKGSTRGRRLDGVRAKQAEMKAVEGAAATEMAASAAMAAVAEEAESAAVQADTMHQGLKAIKAAGLAEEMANEGSAASQDQAGPQRRRVQPPIQPPTANTTGNGQGQDDTNTNENPDSDEQSNDTGDSEGGVEGDGDGAESDDGDDSDQTGDNSSLAKREIEQYRQQEQAKEAERNPQIDKPPEDPYAAEGGRALPARSEDSRPGDSVKWGDGTDPEEVAYKRKKAYDDSVAFSKKAQRAAEGGDGLLARGAGAMARGGEALAGAGRAVGTAVMSGIAKIGLLFVGPTGWIAWLVLGAIIVVIIAITVGGGIFGASGPSPANTGKSFGDPVLATDPILSQIVNASNIESVQTMMQDNRQVILDALQKVDDQCATGKYNALSCSQSTLKVNEIRQLLSQVSNENPAQNASLAPKFQAAVKELLQIWLAADNTIADTSLPLKVDVTPSTYRNHDCTQLNTGACGVAGHRSVFGIIESQSGVPITADAADLTAPEGTTVYAPFSGFLSGNHVEDSEGSFLQGAGNFSNMQAVLLHMKTDRYGTVIAGQPIGKLNSKHHLHFELKIGGRDVARTSSSQTQADLWTRMKKILGGGK